MRAAPRAAVQPPNPLSRALGLGSTPPGMVSSATVFRTPAHGLRRGLRCKHLQHTQVRTGRRAQVHAALTPVHSAAHIWTEAVVLHSLFTSLLLSSLKRDDEGLAGNNGPRI